MNSRSLISLYSLLVLPYFVESACPKIIARAQWGARTPKSPPKSLATIPAPFVVVHHSAGPNCDSLELCKKRVRSFQNYHMDSNNWFDIGYNFMIGGDGNVYEGRGWGIHGAHVPKYNGNSIGICVIGNFMSEKPGSTQLNTLRNLINCSKDTNRIVSNYSLIGHRQGSATNCPGDKLFAEIKSWPNFDNKPSAH